MSDLIWRLRSAAESAAWEANTPGLYGQLLKEAADAIESHVGGDDAKNAARYRWLRMANSIMPGAPGKRPIEWYCGTDADAAIDAAMLSTCE